MFHYGVLIPGRGITEIGPIRPLLSKETLERIATTDSTMVHRIGPKVGGEEREKAGEPPDQNPRPSASGPSGYLDNRKIA